ncbi:hypothetical protein OKW34_000223 [Paraburkholderia youngii]|uniref:hypothetical protein n=1 Tax=Paraburkholderia youngii TaxID=2782701 RepID=UPI003D22232F
MQRIKSSKLSGTCAALLLSISQAACDGKSSPTKENYAKAVQTYFDGKDAVCMLVGAVPFDAAEYSSEMLIAEPLVKTGLFTKEPTSVKDIGSAHRMVPGFHYALTDEGKKAYRRADPAKNSKICGGKAKLLAITFASSAENPHVGDRVNIKYEAKLVDRPHWDDEAVLRTLHPDLIETENDEYHSELYLELTNDGWVVNPSQ